MDVLISQYEVRDSETGTVLADADRMADNQSGWYITIYLKGSGGRMGKELVADISDDEIVERLGWVAARVRELELAAGNLS